MPLPVYLEAGIAAASGGPPAEPAAHQARSGTRRPAALLRPRTLRAPVKAASARCSVERGRPCGRLRLWRRSRKKSYIFAIGAIGFDFGTEARRDSFRQLMPRHQIGGGNGDTPVTVPPNPYDVRQLVEYLDDHKSESTKLIWTLNLDLTPIYAIEAELAYAEDVYEVLRSALRNQALPADNPNYVSRVSIPGALTSRTRRLFSGQVLPVVIAQPRGLYTWNETQLVDAIVTGVEQMQTGAQAQQARMTFATSWTRSTTSSGTSARVPPIGP